MLKVSIINKGESESIYIDKESFVLGRSRKADLTIEHDLVSRNHIKVMFVDEVFQIEDVGSSNGTWLNDQKLNKGIKSYYVQGDSIFLGGELGVEVKLEDCSEKIKEKLNEELKVKNEEQLVKSQNKKNENNLQNDFVNELSQYRDKVLDDELISKIAKDYEEKFQNASQITTNLPTHSSENKVSTSNVEIKDKVEFVEVVRENEAKPRSMLPYIVSIIITLILLYIFVKI